MAIALCQTSTLQFPVTQQAKASGHRLLQRLLVFYYVLAFSASLFSFLYECKKTVMSNAGFSRFSILHKISLQKIFCSNDRKSERSMFIEVQNVIHC